MSKSTGLTLAKATAKVANVLGIGMTDTEDAIAAHETEAAIEVEIQRYHRQVLDLNTEFTLRREGMRQNHIRQIVAISSHREAAE